tara:strand:+ start:4045 stop:5166 length:1122 start_codon:yes stop_codon:yes gene_type:complete
MIYTTAEPDHAVLSASGAHRWALCAGSRKAEEGLPDTTSPAAAEGTVAHELAALTLNHGDHCLDHYADQEMADFVRKYTDYCRQISKGADTLIEHRVDFSDHVPGGFGTADFISISDGTAHIVDLKYGFNRVYAHKNLQGLCYALGVISDLSFIYTIDTITFAIVQPRLDHIDEWSISLPELLKSGEWISQRAEEAMTDGASLTPGESQCRWCKAKATCPALQQLTSDTLMVDFDDLSGAANPDALTEAQLAKALSNKALIVGWLDAVERVARAKLEAGEDFPGWKLVAGRANRKWIDEDKALSALVSILGSPALATTTKVLSPAQAEKALGKARKASIGSLITTPQGQPSLAPAGDPRPAVNVSPNDFEEVR